MLLTYLAHTYLVLGVPNPERPGARAGLLHRGFGEMYNLRTIAETLVRMPLADPPDDRKAGPPFELPPDFELPEAEEEFWPLHRKLLDKSTILAKRLIGGAPPDGARYLAALRQIDSRSIEWMQTFRPALAGDGSP